MSQLHSAFDDSSYSALPFAVRAASVRAAAEMMPEDWEKKAVTIDKAVESN
jgi:hypothetical protein